MAAFHHIALNCRDIDATEAWYVKHFGFVRGRSIPLGDTKIVFIHLGEFYLELFQAGPADPVSGQGDGPATAGLIRHLAFKVDDVDAVLAALGPDARVSFGPLSFDAFIPGWRTAWVVDPDGVIVEISQGYVDG
jgi:glyoxylase I family protein